jgi:hypothetical protein
LLISFGISTSIFINSPPMPSYAFQCICGYAELLRSNRRPKVSLRRIKSIISAALSSKRKATRPWSGTAISAA